MDDSSFHHAAFSRLLALRIVCNYGRSATSTRVLPNPAARRCDLRRSLTFTWVSASIFLLLHRSRVRCCRCMPLIRGSGREESKGCPLGGNQADLFTHAELRHNGSSDLGSFLKIVLSAGRNAAKNHLLGDASAQKNVDSRHEFPSESSDKGPRLVAARCSRARRRRISRSSTPGLRQGPARRRGRDRTHDQPPSVFLRTWYRERPKLVFDNSEKLCRRPVSESACFLSIL